MKIQLQTDELEQIIFDHFVTLNIGEISNVKLDVYDDGGILITSADATAVVASADIDTTRPNTNSVPKRRRRRSKVEDVSEQPKETVEKVAVDAAEETTEEEASPFVPDAIVNPDTKVTASIFG